MKKNAFILSVFAVFILGFLAIAFVWHKSNFKTLAQSDTAGNTNCSNKNGERKNLDSGNKAQENDRCDFSRYKTLKVRSLKINNLPQPKYPPEAKEKNLKGCVPVRVLVDGKGNVTESCAVSVKDSEACSDQIKDDLFKELSEAAAAKAKFDVSRLPLGDKEFFEMTIVYRFAPSK